MVLTLFITFFDLFTFFQELYAYDLASEGIVENQLIWWKNKCFWNNSSTNNMLKNGLCSDNAQLLLLKQIIAILLYCRFVLRMQQGCCLLFRPRLEMLRQRLCVFIVEETSPVHWFFSLTNISVWIHIIYQMYLHWHRPNIYHTMLKLVLSSVYHAQTISLFALSGVRVDPSWKNEPGLWTLIK